MYKICIISIYFGKWPATFPLLIHSMSQNKNIDFMIISDNPKIIQNTENIKYVRSNLHDIRMRFSNALGLDVKLSAPYKICDYRPMFGKIFQNELHGYDFWGHCDLDIVIGSINSFLTKEVLNNNQKILVRGNFSLYRNCELMNRMYEQVGYGPDWRSVVNSDDSYLFDEWPGIYQILRQKSVSIWMNEVILDIRPELYCLQKTHEKFLYPQVMYYENGRIFRFVHGRKREEEFLLIHLQKRKLAPPDFSIADAKRIYFTPTGFIIGENEGLLPYRVMQGINPRSHLKDLEIFWSRMRRKAKQFATKRR